MAAIEAQGWSVWWDPEIDAGQQFDDQIEAELKAARAVAVVWTPTSAASRWVRGEAREAADRGTLVPVRFDGVSLPMDVRAIHTTELDRWGEDASSPPFQSLLRALTAMIARHGGPSPSVGSPAASRSDAPAAAGRIGICVLPFTNMSGDPEQEYFSDGITDDVITDLAKVSALFVVARNTAFALKGKNVDASQVTRQFNVSHVLEGSVRKSGGRVRITAQLIVGSTGGQVWAERYDRDLSDIFALQDEISEAGTRRSSACAAGPRKSIRTMRKHGRCWHLGTCSCAGCVADRVTTGWWRWNARSRWTQTSPRPTPYGRESCQTAAAMMKRPGRSTSRYAWTRSPMKSIGPLPT